MNESDTDTGLEESGQPEEEALGESAPEKDVELAAGGAGEEVPWTPPSEEEHRALLEIKEKADSLVEELLRAKADFENFKKQKTRQAAQDRDVEALSELNDPLYQSCVTCHQHFRTGYGRRQ